MHSTTRRLRRLFFIGIVLVLLLIGAGAGAFLWLKTTISNPAEHAASDRVILVEPGMATPAIIARLSEAGIVNDPTALRLYLRMTGRGGQLKAGAYKFDSPISPLQAIEKIQRGEVAFERVTIPEGFNRFDIAEALATRTGLATEKEFLALMEDQSLISAFAPQARNLEGYLFPDTYNYTEQTTPEELIRAMVTRFNEVFSPEWRARATQTGMTIHQVVTLASVVEEEARVPDERPLIASVFANRLKIGMPLGSDPTFIYAAILAGDYDGNPNQPRHRRRDSTYNTYVYAGLPPGPIASPGRASLQAALYPDESNYLYFVVSGTEGRHKFSRTASEHEAAREEYYRQREQQREQQRAPQ